MRTGVQVLHPVVDTGNLVEDFVAHAERVRLAGLRSMWVPQPLHFDALTLLAVVGRGVPDLELGTAVVVTPPRHPLMLAVQALTTQAACGGRLALGIGPSHASIIEGVFGLRADRPFSHTRAYVTMLRALLAGDAGPMEGEDLRAAPPVALRMAGAPPPPVLLGALGARMLRLAGKEADGTVTAQAGLRTLATHIVPVIAAAAAAAGRPPPRVVACLPVCVTHDVAAGRALVEAEYPGTRQWPTYRALFEREGVHGPADVALVGDESAVAAQLGRLAEAGVTDFAGRVIGSAAQQDTALAVLAAAGTDAG